MAASSHQHYCSARGQAGRQLGQHRVGGFRSRARGSEADLGARQRSRVCWAQPMTVPGSQERGRHRGFTLGSGLVGGGVGAVGATQQHGKALLLFSGDKKSP